MRAGPEPEVVFRREGSSARQAAATLPPGLLAEGVRRLRMLLIPIAVLMVVGAGTTFWLWTRPESGVTLGSMAVWGAVGRLAVVAAMFGLARRRDMDPAEILDRALVLMVLMAFFLALYYFALPADFHAIPRGFSPVAMWIVAHALFVPSTRGKTLLATVGAALMDPLGLLVNVAAGAPMPSTLWMAGLFFPTALAAVVAILGSRIVYRLSREAARARELGSYRLETLLGRGGMGEVWRAEHRLLARPAAVKLIRPERDGGPIRGETLERFRREAHATAALRSPHTVQLYDFGVSDDGSFYYAMELLEGFTLEQLVDRFGPVPAERTVHLLRQACRSLDEAHRAGLIHRDIKPSNLFVCRYGVTPDFVKVLDFGLVKSAAAVPLGRGLTETGILTGTPSTMPPEIARGRKDVDARADLYSLACVGYWLLTGTHVFRQPTAMATIHDHAATPPEPPSRRTARPVPPGLEALLLQCLEKEPGMRPGSARDLARGLDAIPLESPWTEERAESWWSAQASHQTTTEARLQAV